jgi:hypothetical protein
MRPIIRANAAMHPAAGTAVAGLYSLLSRVHPHTIIEGDAEMGRNPWGVARLADLPDRLAPCRPAPSAAASDDLVIGAGIDAPGTHMWVGGNDWTSTVTFSAAPITATDHALGVHAAAAYIAAEVMKIVIGPLGMMHVPAPAPIVWNLFDYTLAPAPDVPDLACRPLDLVFFGTGSVGSSGGALLMCDAGSTGTVVTVDPDLYDPVRNPYRYPASTGREAGPKAAWIRGLLERAGWRADYLEGTVADWVRAQPTPGWPGIAVSSVDRLDGRLDVADALPATVLSLGVSGLALHAQLERTYDNYACPYCDFAGEAAPMTRIQALADQVGLSPTRVAVMELNGAVLTTDDIAAAVAAGRIREEGADGLVGRRLDDLVRRAYAQATVPTPGSGPAAVSAPYVSWMGGVLIAAEVAKAARGLRLLDRRVDLDMSGVPLGVLRRQPRNTSEACVCSSPHRQRWASRLYERPWSQVTTMPS